MRDIKFRAWDEKRKIMFSDKNLFLVIHFNGELNHFDTDGEIMGTKNTEQIPLMQYTGIKDKNGKEIYEGDILEREVFGEDIVGEIVWKDSGITGFWLAVKNDDGTSFYPIGRGQYDDDEGELCNDIVIGNIFENKELLEGSKE